METRSKIRHITNNDSKKFISISRFVCCSTSTYVLIEHISIFLKIRKWKDFIKKGFVTLETKNISLLN